MAGSRSIPLDVRGYPHDCSNAFMHKNGAWEPYSGGSANGGTDNVQVRDGALWQSITGRYYPPYGINRAGRRFIYGDKWQQHDMLRPAWITAFGPYSTGNNPNTPHDVHTFDVPAGCPADQDLTRRCGIWVFWIDVNPKNIDANTPRRRYKFNGRWVTEVDTSPVVQFGNGSFRVGLNHRTDTLLRTGNVIQDADGYAWGGFTRVGVYITFPDTDNYHVQRIMGVGKNGVVQLPGNVDIGDGHRLLQIADAGKFGPGNFDFDTNPDKARWEGDNYRDFVARTGNKTRVY